MKSMEELREKMKALHLDEAAHQVDAIIDEGLAHQKSFLDIFSDILDYELKNRQLRRIQTALKLSGLPKGMVLDTFDFTFQPSVDKDRIHFLATGEFIKHRENVLFFGPPGVGKTHLAVALGVRAIELGYSVYYATADELVARLKRFPTPVTSHKRQGYMKSALVIVDELGYQEFDRHESNLFFQFISARYLKGSIILTSNRSPKDWVSIFARDELVVAAMLDRLFHKAHLFHIDGQSYRLKDYQAFLEARE